MNHGQDPSGRPGIPATALVQRSAATRARNSPAISQLAPQTLGHVHEPTRPQLHSRPRASLMGWSLSPAVFRTRGPAFSYPSPPRAGNVEQTRAPSRVPCCGASTTAPPDPISPMSIATTACRSRRFEGMCLSSDIRHWPLGDTKNDPSRFEPWHRRWRGLSTPRPRCRSPNDRRGGQGVDNPLDDLRHGVHPLTPLPVPVAWSRCSARRRGASRVTGSSGR